LSFDAGLFWSTLVSPAFLLAALTTLSLTILAHAGAILLSLPLALALDS
jgi:ABC-type sulfate transport system permease component